MSKTPLASKEAILVQLKQEILNIQLKPGTILSEATLTERFGLSRTPIRDILKQLSREGYVDIYPQKGSMVSFIDLESVEQVIFLRYTLEKEVAKALSKKLSLKGYHDLSRILNEQKTCIDNASPFELFLQLDDHFHETLFAFAGHSFLWDVIQQFNVHYMRYRQLNMLKKEKLADIHQEHQTLLEHIIKGHIEKLDDLLDEHLRSVVDAKYFQTHYMDYIKGL